MLFVRFEVFFQKARISDVVVIGKQQDIAAGCKDSGVLRGRYARVFNVEILQFNPRREIATYFRGRIFRPIVNHNDLVLVRWQGLDREAFQSLAQHRCAIKRRDYDADERTRSVSITR